MPRVLVIPAETHPCEESFLEEVLARHDEPFRREFLFRSRTVTRPRQDRWHRADLTLMPQRPSWRPFAWFATYFADLRDALHLVRRAVRHDVDVVVARDLTFPLHVAILLRPWAKWSVIYQKTFPHELRWFDPDQVRRYRLPALFRWARRLEMHRLHALQPRADAILPISESMKQELVEEQGCDPCRTHPFGMGVAEDAWSVSRSPVRRDGDPLRMIYVGTLAPSRGLETMVDAIGRARHEHGVDVRLSVFGGKPDEIDALREEVTRRGLEDIVAVRGRVARQEIYRHLAEHDAGAVYIRRDPRFRVASTTKLIESLTVGLPAVCTDAVEMHSTMRDRTGAVVLTDDTAEGFARGIAELDARWSTYSRNVDVNRRAVFEEHSYDRARARLDEVVMGLVASRQGAARDDDQAAHDTPN